MTASPDVSNEGRSDPPDGDRSRLQAVIEAYLRSVGFTSHLYPNGETYWGHRELGQGRRFDQAVTWWIGRETENARRG